MNAQAKEPKAATVIVVPPTLVVLIDELSARMARVTGESTEDTRRAVEISILSRGVAAVQSEIVFGESKSEGRNA
jgi:hypothetical protein